MAKSNDKISEQTAVKYKDKKDWTYEDYLSLPDDNNIYEIINGELIMAPSPIPNHQSISGKIYRILGDYIEKHQLGKIFSAPLDVVFSEHNVIKPDIMFISNKNLNIIGDKNIQAAPDLVIEILSPSTSFYDRGAKKEVYEEYGVEEYWIVDPHNKTVEVFLLKDDKYVYDGVYGKDDKVKVKTIEGLEVDLKDIFTVSEEEQK